jgi:RimJ/RimL family protein N-acetyltransferase
MQMTGLRIRTARLDLVAAALTHVEAELESADRLAALLGARVPASWPPGEYDRGAQEYFRERLEEGGEAVVGWLGWYAVRRETGGEPALLVGAGGYLGPPGPDGEVEMGYSLVPEARGSGYATELAGALLDRALAHPGVSRVVAHTDAGNAASIRVLERTGFHPAGAGAEPGSLRFEAARTSRARP